SSSPTTPSPSPYSPVSSLVPAPHFTSPSPSSSCSSSPANTFSPPEWLCQSDPTFLLPSSSIYWNSNCLMQKEKGGGGGGNVPEDRKLQEQQEEEHVPQIPEMNAVREQDLLHYCKQFTTKKEEAGTDDSSPCRLGVLRRTRSDGALLQEPPLDRFLSDSVIHSITPPLTSDPVLSLGVAHQPPCTHRGGSTLHHKLLLSGTKEPEFKNQQLRSKTKSL
ncbi:uncharacterized protein LOC117506287, partial [Thalassophryne amazonica]|uniref:uncharacterized protein LOC117506287 n=1 Tax=Thalassophryne amazonica TaxID=390379 RepID=UPI001471582F